jgi:FRG domain
MRIESVAGFLKALKKARVRGKPLLWYRGHADKAWALLPGYQRLKNPPPESVLVNRFKQNANLLLGYQPKSNFEWLFIMQHYGVPTRLLDWTESPLVALYFAVSSHEKKDGAVWVLDPVKLNQSTKAKPEDYKFVPAFEDERVAGYETYSVENSPELGIEPIAVMATRNNARIQAQLGVFTISHQSPKKLEEIGDRSHLVCFEIPAAKKPDIAEELEILAFGKFQVFPELSSIGEIIKGAI